MYSFIYVYGGTGLKGILDVDVLSHAVALYMYSKRHIGRAGHQTYFDPDSLLYQCKKVMSLLQHV